MRAFSMSIALCFLVGTSSNATPMDYRDEIYDNALISIKYPGIGLVIGGAVVTLVGVFSLIKLGIEHFVAEDAKLKKSVWIGYEREDFVVDGRHCLVVIPKEPAPGNPWIWRTEFFGHEPQGDLALLAKGYHAVYMDVQNMYGAPVALDHMDKFYAHVTTAYKLSPKAVLEGFSRGGLFALNWAARNPTQVASLYLDAPVCDFKSWPGGKGKGKGSWLDWANCKRAYDFTEEEALAYKLNPVDNLKPLADAKIPILSVCGDADDVVPLSENSGLVETRYKKLGGEIKLIVKPGVGHHPHSLKDPTPIVDFILAHQPK